MPGRRANLWVCLAIAGAASAAGARAEDRLFVHDRGFAILVDDLALVDVTEDGFQVLPEGQAGVRSPPTVEIRFLDGDPASPMPLDRTRSIGGETIDYAIDTVTVGSGGTEYTLSARRPLCGGVLELVHREQHEFGGTPDFEAGWQILMSATCVAEQQG